MKTEEILKILDVKYLRGEMPLELYTKLRREYEQNAKRDTEQKPADPAYR